MKNKNKNRAISRKINDWVEVVVLEVVFGGLVARIRSMLAVPKID